MKTTRDSHPIEFEGDLADCVDVLGLGERQEKVAELRLRGHSRAQIAHELGIHLGTVHTHIRRTARVVGDESLLALVNAVFRRVRDRDRRNGNSDDQTTPHDV